jgi:NitT/TauT family transport system substrate-binding protein
MRNYMLFGVVAVALVAAAGCKPSQPAGGTSATGGDVSDAGGTTPAFTLAWSEYPSWSVFGVAHELGLINGGEGELGTIEQKHNVDIVLDELGYDSCLNAFTSKNCDAVCMTNMDALIVSPNRDGVALLPTSTSNGADACIVVGINTLEELKAHKVYGLKGTVSEYCFVRGIEEAEKAEKKGYKAEDFQFTNQDPGAAAVAMAQKQESHRAIMVWNPFVLQTLNDRPDAKVLFDSTAIPGEIVDMVVMGRDALEKPGANAFAKAIIETFYQMNTELSKPDGGDEVLVELGRKFSKLGLEDMKKVVQQTQFYKTPAEAVALLNGDEFKATMATVADFCVKQGLVENPQYGFGGETGKQLVFDASYIQSTTEGGNE